MWSVPEPPRCGSSVDASTRSVPPRRGAGACAVAVTAARTTRSNERARIRLVMALDTTRKQWGARPLAVPFSYGHSAWARPQLLRHRQHLLREGGVALRLPARAPGSDQGAERGLRRAVPRPPGDRRVRSHLG